MSSLERAARDASLSRELDVALDAARSACAILRSAWDALARTPERAQRALDPLDAPATRADVDADEAIRARVLGAFPDDGWLSEESRERAPRAGERTWIVDALDGTHELLALVPEFAVSIALVERGAPILGVVANPIEGAVVAAVRGGGCFRDGARTRVSSQTRLDRATAIASRSETRRGDWRAIAGWFAEVRELGSVAWKLAAIASGVGDLTVSLRPKRSFDVCAGDLLVREAGGVYTGPGIEIVRYAPARVAIPAGMVAGPRELADALLERARSEPALLDPGGANAAPSGRAIASAPDV